MSRVLAEATGDGDGSDTDNTREAQASHQAGEDDKAHLTQVWGGGAQPVPQRQVVVLSAQECLLGQVGGHCLIDTHFLGPPTPSSALPTPVSGGCECLEGSIRT